MALIEAKNLTIRFDRKPVLENVNLAISKREIVTLIGPNGSGKSTLVRAFLGLVKPATGKITRQPGLRIGYVPQKLGIEATMPITVSRFLSLPRRRSPDALSEVSARVGIANLASNQMSSLSGGQFQKVLLARALLMSPDILILDEPTQGLDQPGVAHFYKMLSEIRQELGCAVLLVSHDLHVVMSASDRVICVNGHICCEGSPQVVSEAPEYRALFGVGTGGTLALYRHEHDHSHESGHDHG